MSRKGHKIGAVDPGSIAEALELEPGDCVLSIDGHELEDIFDYEYYMNSESIVMEVRKADGEEWELEIENGYEDLGITFENGLMSEYRSCRNKICVAFMNSNLLQMLVQCSGLNRLSKDFLSCLMLKAVYKTCTLISINDIPHLGLAIVTFVFSCIFIIGMNLNRQVLFGIDEFHQYRQFSIFYFCSDVFWMLF